MLLPLMLNLASSTVTTTIPPGVGGLAFPKKVEEKEEVRTWRVTVEQGIVSEESFGIPQILFGVLKKEIAVKYIEPEEIIVQHLPEPIRIKNAERALTTEIKFGASEVLNIENEEELTKLLLILAEV